MPERTQTVTVADGGFDLRLWIPERGSGPGLLLIPEIWGVSDYIRAVAADLAELGYVVGVPDLFWRCGPAGRPRTTRRGCAPRWSCRRTSTPRRGRTTAPPRWPRSPRGPR